MCKSISERGFTLLELLIVITIVGLLASVAIFSLKNSKDKGAEAAIKSALVQAHDQAEIFFNSHSRSYEGVCANDLLDKNTIGRFLIASQKTYGAPVNQPYTDDVAGSFSPIREVCHDSSGEYAAWVPLVYSANSAWCIDSRNVSKMTSFVLPANQTFCP